jgi:hypothetical protein
MYEFWFPFGGVVRSLQKFNDVFLSFAVLRVWHHVPLNIVSKLRFDCGPIVGQKRDCKGREKARSLAFHQILETLFCFSGHYLN